MLIANTGKIKILIGSGFCESGQIRRTDEDFENIKIYIAYVQGAFNVSLWTMTNEQTNNNVTMKISYINPI